MAGSDKPHAPNAGTDDDDDLPTFKREAGALLSKNEREIADRSATEAANRSKSDPALPDDAQRGA